MNTWIKKRRLSESLVILLLAAFSTVSSADGDLKAHAFYALAGAASVIFAVAPECRRLTGVDPMTPEAVERHADFVARLLVP